MTNTVVTVYDAANRATQTPQHLREKGLGQNPPAAGETLLPFGGGSVTTIAVYDAASDVTQYTDEMGNVFDNTLDPLGRKTECDITKATAETVIGYYSDSVNGRLAHVALIGRISD